MKIDIAERLQCPRDHAATPLIVVTRRVDGREILDGIAGCPVCRLEGRIGRTEIVFEDKESLTSVPFAEDGAPGRDFAEPDADRIAAQLGLAEPGGVVLLCGRYGAVAERLALQYEVLAVTTGAWPLTSGEVVRASLSGAGCFTNGTFRGIALDDDSSASGIGAALRMGTATARVLAPTSLSRPEAVTELARDEREWVGVIERTGPLLSLSRSPAH